MSKSEWPTAQRLESLRLKGIVPVSQASLRMTACAVLFIYLVAQIENISSTLIALAQSELSLESLSEHLNQLHLFILVPALLSLTAVLLAGLFQTKFLFRPSLCTPDPKRFSGKILSKEKFQSAGLALLLFGVILSVSILLFWTYAREYLSLLNAAPSDIMNYLTSWSTGAVLVSAVVLALLAFFSWMLARISFMFRHRMSRLELLGEAD